MAAPQQGNPSDNSAAILWGIAGVFVAIAGIWYAFKSYIVAFYLTLKLYEVHLLSYFSATKFVGLQAQLKASLVDPGKVSFQDLLNLGLGVGEYLRYPFVVVLFLLAIALYFGNTTRVYRRVYSMKDLAAFEKNNWPQISPVIGLDLIKTDIDKGPWAMAMNPMQFCKRFKLLEEIRPQRREGMTRREWDRVDVILKKGEANKIFALQLGPLWKGSSKLPPHAKALFAVFAARANADTKAAEKLLHQLNNTAGSRLDITGADELLRKHENTKIVQSILSTHAYVLTVMASMLEAARDDGVQASADFLWLKPVDRRLWYMLNTVGRQTPFSEVAGAFAHWVAEKEAGRRLLVPTVEEATKALELALKEIIYRPDDEMA